MHMQPYGDLQDYFLADHFFHFYFIILTSFCLPLYHLFQFFIGNCNVVALDKLQKEHSLCAHCGSKKRRLIISTCESSYSSAFKGWDAENFELKGPLPLTCHGIYGPSLASDSTSVAAAASAEVDSIAPEVARSATIRRKVASASSFPYFDTSPWIYDFVSWESTGDETTSRVGAQALLDQVGRGRGPLTWSQCTPAQPTSLYVLVMLQAAGAFT